MSSIPKLDALIYNSNLGGTTGTKLYKNASNKKWVVKRAEKGGGEKQIRYEYAANIVYRLFNVPVPNHQYDEASKSLILKYIDGKLLKDASPDEFLAAKEALKKKFVVDALLANWDVIGYNKDNIIISSGNGQPYRIDNGGTFMFRAQGKPKPYTSIVHELDTMRDSSKNPQAAAIFGDLTDTEIDNQIKTIIIPYYEKMIKFTKVFLPNDPTVVETFKQRLDFLVDRTVWMNASQFKNTVVETETPEYIEPVQKALVQFFNPTISSNKNSKAFIDYLNSVLVANGAIISGGFILKAIGAFVDESSVDMDIYVSDKTSDYFVPIMQALFNPEKVVKHVQSETSTFFKKNGIKSVTKYAKTKPKYMELDIVEVDSESGRQPKDVVMNFDLTFCENWYDGKTVYMTYPEHVKTKHGSLEKHYLNLYYKGNPVLLKRMNKYIKRGFHLSIYNPITKSIKNVTQTIKDKFQEQQQEPSLNNKVGIANRSSKKSSKNKQPFANQSNINQSNLNAIQNSFEQQPSNLLIENITSNNVTKLYEYGNNNNTQKTFVPQLQKEDISEFQYLLLRWYTGYGSSQLNPYLYNLEKQLPVPVKSYFIDMEYKEKVRIIKYLTTKYEREPTETLDKYNERILYYIVVNLYNSLGKSLRAKKVFEVFRGSKKAYLQEDPSRFFYINSFMSTSLSAKIARTMGSLIHIFYVHPFCMYSDISKVSKYKNEEEVLFTPYNRCVYISGDNEIKHFALFPTDLVLPNDYEDFKIFNKEDIKGLSKPIKGGSNNNRNNNPNIYKKLNNTRRNNNNRNSNLNLWNIEDPTMSANNTSSFNTNSNSSNNNPTIPNNNTTRRNNKTNTTNSQQRSILSRFEEPIHSFPGKPLTVEERKMVNEIKKYIEGKS
jgi:hypothetical protein